MKKRIFLGWLLLYFVLSMANVEAKTIIVESLCTANSSSCGEYSFRVLSSKGLDEKQFLEEGSIVKGRITKMVDPKRLKKDGYFVFVPHSFTLPSKGNAEYEVKNKKETKIKDHEVIAKINIAQNAGIYAASRVVPGFGCVVNFAQGVAEPEEDENRFHSGCRNAFEKSPLSYCLKGAEICLYCGDKVRFTFDEKIFAFDEYDFVQ